MKVEMKYMRLFACQSVLPITRASRELWQNALYLARDGSVTSAKSPIINDDLSSSRIREGT